jgi:hypothetical protein
MEQERLTDVDRMSHECVTGVVEGHGNGVQISAGPDQGKDSLRYQSGLGEIGASMFPQMNEAFSRLYCGEETARSGGCLGEDCKFSDHNEKLHGEA